MSEPHDRSAAEAPLEADAEVPAEPGGSFGDSRVDAAVGRLAELRGRPVADHVSVFEAVHARFRDALEDAADDPGAERAG